MNTKLLIAASATALLGFAGAASAIDLTLADVTGAANDAIEAPVVIANEVASALFASPQTTALEMALTPSLSAIMPAGNSILTLTLTGGAVDTASVSAGDVIWGGTCQPTRSVISTSATEVKFLVSTLAGCDNANPFLIQLPVILSTVTNVSVAVDFRTEGNTPIDGGTDSVDVITYANGYTIGVVAGADFPRADVALNPAYTDFEAPLAGATAELGEVTYAASAGVFSSLGDDGSPPTPVSTADINFATITLTRTSGNLGGLVPSFEGQTLPLSSSTLISASEVIVNANLDLTGQSVFVTPSGTAITGGTFTVTAVADITASGVNFTESSGAVAVNPVTLGGTNFVAPWVPFANATPTGFIRLSNASPDDSGPVSLTLLAWSNGTPASTTCTLPGVVPGNGTYTINGAMMRDCFGTGINNGDIRVTIQSNLSNLNAKLRVQDGSGDTFEQSLGTLASYAQGVVE